MDTVAGYKGSMSMDMSIHAYGGYSRAWIYDCMGVWGGFNRNFPFARVQASTLHLHNLIIFWSYSTQVIW